jgi:flagella basal body P-ring formation protein FlgA
MVPLLALSMAVCLPIASNADKILARDIAAAFPALAAAAPDAEIGLAPAPGVPRVFQPADILMLAARYRIEDARGIESFCVARPVAPLEAANLLAAMQQSLPQARIEILEFSRQPAPEGEMEFRVENLHGTVGNSTGLWNGSVRYAGARRFRIWAKVKVLVAVTRVTAAVDLRPGQPIDAAQLTVSTREEFPSTSAYAQAIEDVAGRWPRLPIHAGSLVRIDQMEQPKDVMRGETVKVEVRNGATLLAFVAVAQGSGSVGDYVAILNPDSHKTFRARVEAKGQVSVNAAPAILPANPAGGSAADEKEKQ